MSLYSSDHPQPPRHFGTLATPPETPVSSAENLREDMRTVLVNRVAMGAVAAGVCFALTVQLILNMLGVGIGVIAVPETATTTASMNEFSWTAAFWWAGSGIIAAFAGGIAAGRLCGDAKEGTAIWHGLTAWAASVLVIAGLALTGAGVLVSGSFSSLARLAQSDETIVSSIDALTLDKLAAAAGAAAVTADKANGPAAAANPPALPYTGTADPAGVSGTMSTNPDGSSSVDVTVNRPPVPVTNPYAANMYGDNITPTLRGDAAAEVEPAAGDDGSMPAERQSMLMLAKASLVSAVALILGALAAAFGGAIGTVQPTVSNPAIRKYFH